ISPPTKRFKAATNQFVAAPWHDRAPASPTASKLSEATPPLLVAAPSLVHSPRPARACKNARASVSFTRWLRDEGYCRRRANLENATFAAFFEAKHSHCAHRCTSSERATAHVCTRRT